MRSLNCLRLWSVALLGGVGALSSCNKSSSASSVEFQKLKEEMVAMREESATAAATAKVRDGELQGLKEENRALKQGLRQLDEMKVRAEAAEKGAAELRKQVEELKRKAVSRVRQKAIGESIASISCPNGRTYTVVVIRAIDDSGVSIRHEGGSATLGLDSCPREWVERFSLSVPEPPKAVAAAPVAEVPVLASSSEPAAPSSAVVAKPAGSDISPAVVDDIGKRLMPSVVIIKGDHSEGTGFFVREGDLVYLYTASHVLNGNTRLDVTTTDGRVFKRFGSFEVADGMDLVRFGVNEEVPAATTLCAPGSIKVAKPLFAIGNSGGGGVLTVLAGAVTGLGNTEFEVDASVIQGNSGGPVFSSPDGHVMGLVTRAVAARTDVWAEDTPFSNVRRFACRLDTDIQWRASSVGAFLGEYKTIQDINRVTRLLCALAVLRPRTDGLRAVKVGNGLDALQIVLENREMPAVKSLVEMNTQISQKNIRISDRDLLKRYAGYYQDILSAAGRQTSSFNPEGVSFVNREDARLSMKWRGVAEGGIRQMLASLGY